MALSLTDVTRALTVTKAACTAADSTRLVQESARDAQRQAQQATERARKLFDLQNTILGTETRLPTLLIERAQQIKDGTAERLPERGRYLDLFQIDSEFIEIKSITTETVRGCCDTFEVPRFNSAELVEFLDKLAAVPGLVVAINSPLPQKFNVRVYVDENAYVTDVHRYKPSKQSSKSSI